MDEEYFQIREALIKLLCIGDKINIIYSFDDEYFGVVKECNILDLNDRHIKLQSTPYNIFMVEISDIEVYEGRLYVWESKRPHSEKMEKMIDLIEFKGTVFV